MYPEIFGPFIRRFRTAKGCTGIPLGLIQCVAHEFARARKDNTRCVK